MKLRLVSTLVLVLGIAALASASAFAGNGNGKGNAKDDSGAPATAVSGTTQGHGNSADAPGQLKKDEAPAPAAAPAVVGATQASPTEPGVKPSNDTGHDTHAAASSDDTKLYGNGKTAGQIAQQNGAKASTVLHGPGDSQPHKASPCTRGHEVDVHALKGKRGGSCGNVSPPPHSTPDPVKNPDPAKGPDPARNPDPAKGPPASGPVADPAATPVTVVVSGTVAVTKVIPKHRGGGVASGILGATGALGNGSLPFTGINLWSTMFVAVALMLIGLALCQRARSLPVRESEREARP